MVWISIEGSIGSGKTTIINKLYNDYSSSIYGVFREPVEVWKPYLDNFYAEYNPQAIIDFKSNAMLLQLRINTSFSQIFKNFENKKVVITERSSYSAINIFSKILVDQGTFTSLNVDLLKENINLVQTYEPDYFIYLKTDHRKCYDRIIQRGDKPIDINYLEKLNYHHDQVFLNNNKVFVVETSDKDIENVEKEIINIIRFINRSEFNFVRN